MRTTIRSLGVLALAALAVVAKGRAQVKVEFTPFAGSYVPTAHLFPMGTPPDVYLSWASVRQEAGLALGSRITAWLTDRFAIDGSFGYSGSGAAKTQFIDGACPCPEASPFCCAQALTSNTTGHTWTVSARLLYVVASRPSSTALYILGGPAYVRHRDEDFIDRSCSGTLCDAVGTAIAGKTASPGAVFGIGARFKVPRTALALRAELEDYWYSARFSGPERLNAWSSSQVQNDLLLSLGLSVRPGRAAAR